MSDVEAEQHAAEDKAAALHALGWQVGAGAAIWARVIADELARHDSARKRFDAQAADRVAWDRIHGSGLVLVVAIAQVLAFEERVSKLTVDGELANARAAFDAVAPRARALRNVATHRDAYAVGKGHRQTGQGHRREPRVAERHVQQLIYWTNSGGTFLHLGGDAVNLHTASEAAIALAEVVERVREKHLVLTEERANAALRRRFGES